MGAAADRPDPVALLEEQAATRVPELVPIRYGRMLVSPFTFYRGAALIMAADLAGDPALGHHRAALRRRPPVELRRVRLAGAPADVRHQRLRRDAARPVGVGRQAAGGELRDRRPRPRLRRRASDARSCWPRPREYRTRMRGFAAMRNLDVWYAHIDIERAARASCGRASDARAARRRRGNVAKARTRDSMQAFAKLTARGRRRARGSSATRR